ncbi:hypothetical protein [Mesorhizobium sp.]|uniref:hypothetical protein n=1 Tax=Mesorhizobium sp. TaxID=1871066 RepID=UPI000FE62760|nr:hypothetical protein [Mesorhizobium sp.]RWD98769.1 MAG: hypothetical protein EOS40_22680 [Mesorhizobium sp.]
MRRHSTELLSQFTQQEIVKPWVIRPRDIYPRAPSERVLLVHTKYAARRNEDTFPGALPRQFDVVHAVGQQEIKVIPFNRVTEDSIIGLPQAIANTAGRSFDALPEPLQMTLLVPLDEQTVQQTLHMAGTVYGGEHLQFRQGCDAIGASCYEARPKACGKRLREREDTHYALYQRTGNAC